MIRFVTVLALGLFLLCQTAQAQSGEVQERAEKLSALLGRILLDQPPYKTMLETSKAQFAVQLRRRNPDASEEALEELSQFYNDEI